MKQIIFLLVILVFCVPVFAQDDDAPQAGDTRVDEWGIEQVYVPAGCFMMGTSEAEAEFALSLNAPSWTRDRLDSEQPQHEVCLTVGYWIDTYEVTNAAFQAFADAGGYTAHEYWSEDGLAWLDRQLLDRLPRTCDDKPLLPHVCVNWFEAEAYANWRGGALPTEAQWEYAARGPESLIYPWGNEWNADFANVTGRDDLTPVGSFDEGVSWVGAHDMAGNAMEWVQDWLDDDYYELGVSEDPTGPEEGTIKIEKGGWWGSNPFVARSAYHHFEDPPSYQDHHIGFRIVSPAVEDES